MPRNLLQRDTEPLWSLLTKILREIKKEIEYKDKGSISEEPVFLLKPTVYLTNYIDSLTPYLDNESSINERIVPLKVKELVLILVGSLPALGNVLFDFS